MMDWHYGGPDIMDLVDLASLWTSNSGLGLRGMMIHDISLYEQLFI